MSMSIFERNLDEHAQVCAALRPLATPIEDVARAMVETLRGHGKLMLCGNGGSAADCQHWAAELTGRFLQDRPPLAAVALTTDTSALTCIGNDYSFEEIFSRQVLALGRPGDVLVAISTSGNSHNVIRAVEAARSLRLCTVGLLGRDGGRLASICRHCIVVPSQTTARIQEAHGLIVHTLCGMIESQLGLA
jgi:D-sedoheptulose 7-phosphate isomerase